MGEPLDEQRRRAYLRAMGIDLWLPRVIAGEIPELALPSAALAEARPAISPAEPPGPAVARPIEPPVAVSSASGLPPDWTPESLPEGSAGPQVDSEPGPVGPAAVVAPVEPAPTLALPDLILNAPHPESLGWEDLAAAVAACRACGLCETRTQTVFGVGNRDADLLVIGEAPGADEDREGEPFVGRAGRLLNQMLLAIGLPRSQVYIANILKCRPPGNRDPRPDEVLRCQGFLQRQVALIRPRVILSVGRISAQTLLATDTPVGRLRGRWLAYGLDSIPLRVTYHPAYLLRSPDQKAKAWEDLTEVVLRLAAG
jgi:uracil-DNA glycosylase